MENLNKAIQEFSFYEREKENGKTVRNKCGRDFLYYALNFYFPEEFDNEGINPKEIDRLKLFGEPVSPLFAWTQVQFANAGSFFYKKSLKLFINDREINGYFSFVCAIIFSRKECKTAITEIEDAIDKNEAVGVDISLGMFGLLDHVLFVYGYDAENLYVFDTHRVSNLEYDPVDEHMFYFKLSKATIEKRWSRFGRVWGVKKS